MELNKPVFYATKGSAGFDIPAAEDYFLQPGDVFLISTGLFIKEMSDMEVLDIRSRSGLAFKQGLIVLNSPGTVDSTYRQEIKVMIKNVSNESRHIKTGDRIAQGVVLLIGICTPNNLSSAPTRMGGFGSTGV